MEWGGAHAPSRSCLPNTPILQYSTTPILLPSPRPNTPVLQHSNTPSSLLRTATRFPTVAQGQRSATLGTGPHRHPNPEGVAQDRFSFLVLRA